ncbi:MAG TPA: hypothetical protein VGM03_17020 [Phycisphaerae bacterium]
MMTPFHGSLMVLALTAAGLPGCMRPPESTPSQMRQGLVLVLPGIEGPSPFNASIANGLRDGGVDGAIEIFDWGTPAGPLTWWLHLTDYDRNVEQARRLSDEIRRYKRSHPDAPLDLVAHSGGAGIALLALEDLPREVRVNSVVLLGAAVSPDYDLNRALNATQRGIWNFYSKMDVGFLGAGTLVFGTVDRAHRVAAGAVGFDTSRSFGDPRGDPYSKLHQVPYQAGMAGTWNLGTHIGWSSPGFVREWLAPLIRAGYPPEPRGPALTFTSDRTP